MPKINHETGKVYPNGGCYGSTLPANCLPGDTFIKIDAANGQQLYACVVPNQWVVQGGSGGSSAWADITGKPSTFPPEVHTHEQAEVTGLVTALSGKAASSHTHVSADITDLAPAGGVPAGAVVMIVSGTCSSLGAGWVEETTLNGKFVLGTLATNADMGTSGGQDTVTSVLNHTHAVNVTDPGHTHLTQRYPTATGGSSGFTIDTSMSGTLANNTLPTASATTGITASTVNPAGGVASIDNRPAFVKVIFCRKT